MQSTLWGLIDILHINLSANSLSGSLPSDIGNLKVLTKLDLSRNQLTGDLPITIGDLKDLKHLSLADNRIQGSIPQSFGNMISLELLDLSRNSLSGAIPKSLEALLYLTHLNVSFNSLEGEVPSGGPFVNFSSLSFMGNQGLCGQQRMQLPPCKTSTSRRSNTTAGLVLKYILPATLSTILVLVLIIVYLKWHKKNANQPNQDDSLPLETWRRIPYRDLERATDGFSESNFLGSGSFGSVYKGKLQDGVEIAVKVFNMKAEKALSFETEYAVMGSIRHRNLTKIISSCSSGDFKGLVLEFMTNGSLEKWLYSDEKVLDLVERLNIMIDVASAIEYLHHGYTSTIVHCDLKPSNGLLDEDLVAHLSDFGLAKLLGDGDSETQTMTLATIGYMAPEFGSEGIVSAKGDVYSYGILLLETFTRKPTDEMFDGEMDLKRWMRESLSADSDSDAVIQVVDDYLLRNYDEDFEANKGCLISIMQLSLKCLADSPEERIDIGAVLATLNKIKVKFIKDSERN